MSIILKPIINQGFLMSKISIGRNERCHCGSGKKYKHCCLQRDAASAQKTPLLKAGNISRIASPGTSPNTPYQHGSTSAPKRQLRAVWVNAPTPPEPEPVELPNLIERTFGNAIASTSETPPQPRKNEQSPAVDADNNETS